MDAYQLVTQASRSPIANVCDADHTVVAKATSGAPCPVASPSAIDYTPAICQLHAGFDR
jgi:hypothetical protein